MERQRIVILASANLFSERIKPPRMPYTMHWQNESWQSLQIRWASGMMVKGLHKINWHTRIKYIAAHWILLKITSIWEHSKRCCFTRQQLLQLSLVKQVSQRKLWTTDQHFLVVYFSNTTNSSDRWRRHDDNTTTTTAPGICCVCCTNLYCLWTNWLAKFRDHFSTARLFWTFRD
jgi:hypothetical protein